MPPPSQVLDTAKDYIFAPPGSGPYAGRFLNDALASLGRVGGGFALAVALGMPLGIISGRLRFMRLFLDTFINGVRAVPGIAWLPLALVWFGIGFKTTVFLVSLASFFPIYLGAAAGAMQVNPLLLRAGAMMGLGRGQLIFSVLIPAAMPHVVTGLRLGLGIAFAYLVLGELTGVPDGLGAAIMDARMLGRVGHHHHGHPAHRHHRAHLRPWPWWAGLRPSRACGGCDGPGCYSDLRHALPEGGWA